MPDEPSPFDRDDYPVDYPQWLWILFDTFRTSFGDIGLPDVSLWERRGNMLEVCNTINDPS